MNNTTVSKKWSRSTGLAFWGTTIQTAFSFLGISFMMYVFYNLSDIMLDGILSSLGNLNLDYYEDRFKGFIGCASVCLMISFLGYIFYLIGICLFKGAQRTLNSLLRARNIMLVELIMPALLILLITVVFNDPQTFLNGLSSVIMLLVLCWGGSIAAIIILLVQFKSLAKEESWTETSRNGADNIRFSYVCVLTMQAVLILGIALIALLVYSSITKIQSMSYDSYGMYGALSGISSFTQEVQNLAKSVKMILLFTNLLMIVFLVLNTVYKIMGWNKIKTGGNEEVYDFGSRIVSAGLSSASNRFCHKCGTQLPEGSVFCPSCGAPVAEVHAYQVGNSQNADRNEEQIDEYFENPQIPSSSADDAIEYEDYEDEEEEKKKKLMLWGGIAIGVIAVAAALWAFLGGSSKFEPDASVFVIDTPVYETVNDGKGENLIANLVYGSSVQIIASEFEDDVYTEVNFSENGKTLKGFINKYNIISKEQFANLEAAGFDDENLRKQLSERLQRLAIAHAAGNLGEEWHVEILDDADYYANAKNVYIRNASPSERCFAFAMKKGDSEDDRKTLVYSLPLDYEIGNVDNPVFLYEEHIPIDKRTILDVTFDKRKNSYNVSYTIGYGYCGDEEEDEFETEGKEKMFAGTVEMSGLVDGKYPVKMELTIHPDHTLSGTVTYTKYNVPMDITGTFTDRGYSYDFSLDETSEGEITGNFIGSYDGLVFSGTWVKADGTKEMPFRLER